MVPAHLSRCSRKQLGGSLLAFGLLPLTFFCPHLAPALIPRVSSTAMGTSWRGRRPIGASPDPSEDTSLCL